MMEEIGQRVISSGLFRRVSRVLDAATIEPPAASPIL
jgi:hypothetical protein